MARSQPASNQRDQMQTRRIVEDRIVERPRTQTQTRPQVQAQQQNQSRMPNQRQGQAQRPTQQEAPVLAVQNERQMTPSVTPMIRTKSAPKDAFRMPIGEEHSGKASFCLRCRQKDHTSMGCTYCRYCSYCDKETGNGEVDHTNRMHRLFLERGREDIIATHRAERNQKVYGNK